MVSHLDEFRRYTADLASSARYVTYLHDIERVSGMVISPQTLRSAADIERFAAKLHGYSDKSVRNYESVMRKYVSMVWDLKLQ